jgi:hypothetical protein
MTEPTTDPLDLRSLESDAPTELDAGALFEGVAEQVAAEKGLAAWLRNRATPERLGIAIISVVAISLLVLLLTGRVDWPVYPLPRMGWMLGGLGLLYLLMVWIALLPAYKPTPQRVVIVGLAALGLALPFVQGLLPMAHDLHTMSLQGAGDDLLSKAVACFTFGSIVAIPLVVIVALLDRDRQGSGFRRLFTALCGGLAGILALQLHCPITQPIHLIWGHATVATGMVLMVGLFHAVRGVRRR